MTFSPNGEAPAPRSRAATYRVQLNSGFTFGDAAAIAGYLARLGVSHLYCSPILQAAAGSTHGYDVIDHSRLNAELGGTEGYARLADALTASGLRQVLDIVPNHMAVGGPDSAWWWDVLTHGRASRYERCFDIDWDPPQPELAGIVLVPVLGDHYGRVLEAGELTVQRAGRELVVRYHEHEFPLAPGTLDGLARDGDGTITDAAIEALNRDADALDALLRRQHYRLAYWRTAAQQLNYRRFFDITTLAGLRAEDPAVFGNTHRLILGLVRDGTVDGLRVDHIDGLADPAGYAERLREAMKGEGEVRGEAYVVVEKILEPGEELPGWPVAGTSGYDFLTLVNQLYTDSAGAAAMRACYARFTGQTPDYAEVVHAAKMTVMRDSLAAEVERLTGLLAGVCDRHRRERDFTRPQLRDTLREVIAAFGVYRGYPRPGHPVSPAGQAHIAAAMAAARQRRPDLDAELIGFIGELLALRHRGAAEDAFAVRFGQVSAPVMAKGVEDTAFYRYQVLASLCEVGGDPGRFGVGVADFHRAMAAAARDWPEGMLTLSTHDTKRSGDVRARLALLAELPDGWEQAAARWARGNERHKRGGWPDPGAEYLLYQTLAGAWPVSAERAAAFLAKAVREAKVHTSWTEPNAGYDEAGQSFVTAILADEGFVADLEDFLAVHRIVERGRVSSLAQTALLLTCPGVPDLYQGTELWDLSLVDPDNRRPVDYAVRARLLDDLADAEPEQALARADEGGPKLWLIHRLLAHRRRHPESYGPASGYEPLPAGGTRAEHAVAFARTAGLAVIVPRLVVRLDDSWQDTTVTLPDGRWTDVLTGATVSGGAIGVAELLHRFPVAVLGRED
jgi:(1->4)-alpha-D-glucan 1-alpha-D-glucosylmutase